MLESETSLLTWALPAFPTDETLIEAEQLPDHRIAYLEYEGAVSNDRGVVSRVESGTYEVLYKSDEIFDARLTSRRLTGRIRLAYQPEKGRWEVSWKPEA